MQPAHMPKKDAVIRIRTARLSDLEQAAAVEAACFPAAEAADTEAIKARLLAYPTHFFVLTLCSRQDAHGMSEQETDAQGTDEHAEDQDETIIGFLNGMVTDEPDLRDEMYEDASLHNEEGRWQMIFGLDVLPEYRRRGYAGKLLRHAISEAVRERRKGLVLTCKEALIHYYASFGFVDEGISGSTHGDVVWHQMRLGLWNSPCL